MSPITAEPRPPAPEESIHWLYEPLPEGARATFAEQGVLVLGPPGLQESWFQLLVEESRRQRSGAWACEHLDPPEGVCAQRNRRAELGPLARRLISSEALLEPLGAVAGVPLRPGFEASCYTYYETPGDFLATHRDRPDSCALTLLLYLEASHMAESALGEGLMLYVYDEGDDAGYAPRLRVRARPNRLVFLRGASLPHSRPPLGIGERVSLLSACFAVR